MPCATNQTWADLPIPLVLSVVTNHTLSDVLVDASIDQFQTAYTTNRIHFRLVLNETKVLAHFVGSDNTFVNWNFGSVQLKTVADGLPPGNHTFRVQSKMEGTADPFCFPFAKPKMAAIVYPSLRCFGLPLTAKDVCSSHGRIMNLLISLHFRNMYGF